MATRETTTHPIEVRARNIGGIDYTEVTLPPGITVLRGRNATHRTSFLQAIVAGLGSVRPSLKADADEGRAVLEIGQETYTRTLTRRNGEVVFDGEPYLDDPEPADLFAFLLENNEARLAVARGGDLRELIMRPIDTNAIEAEIRARQRDRDEIDARLEELTELESKLTKREAERTDLRETLTEKQARFDDLQTEIADADADLDDSRAQKQELEAAFENVRTARAELENLQFERSTAEATLEDLEAERAELKATLDESVTSEMDPDQLANRIEDLRRRKRDLDDTLGDLQRVISFNEEMLAEDGIFVGIDTDAEKTRRPTDRLINDSDPTVCWSCGSRVSRDAIEETIEQLQAYHKEKLATRNELQNEIDELAATRSELLERTEELEQAESRLADVTTEIEQCHDRIATLDTQIEEKEAEVTQLETAAQDTGEADYDEIIELHRTATELELEIERLEAELGDLDGEIDNVESALADRDDLRKERETLTEELTELRTRVDRIEADAVKSFNEHMGSVLEILEYDNIDRIWIERLKHDESDVRQQVSQAEFELHVVRSDAEGATYRDSVAHLSESERSVTGLVFALAGYLAHEVYEDLPFIVLDSLEVIDSDRIGRIVEYFGEYVEYLVVALLPEDAAALDGDYEVVTEL